MEMLIHHATMPLQPLPLQVDWLLNNAKQIVMIMALVDLLVNNCKIILNLVIFSIVHVRQNAIVPMGLLENGVNFLVVICFRDKKYERILFGVLLTIPFMTILSSHLNLTVLLSLPLQNLQMKLMKKLGMF